MTDEQSNPDGQPVAEVDEEDLSGLQEWIESRAAELGDGLSPQRALFWSQVARRLDPTDVGKLITLKELNEERDGLTGILNRRGLQRALEDAMEWERRTQQPLTLVFMDLDRFKALNDTYGHQVGDAVLKDWVSFMRKNLRRTDSLGRFGGEEVVAVLPGCSEQQGYLMFNRIREDMTDALLNLLSELGVDEPITMSVGVAEHQPGETAAQLLERADGRMYEAKQSGRNLVIGGAPASGPKH